MVTAMSKSNRCQPKRNQRRGGAVVEAALVLPMIIMFLFGILEYGRYIMTLQVMTNAAREGARFALAHTQPVTVGGTTYGNATSDVSAVVNKALAGQSLQGQNVQIYASDSLGNNIGSWNSAQAGDLVCVRITGNYKSVITTLLHLSPTIPVTVQAAMRSESN
jgi:Flp pilus assembly protein TadG